MNKLAEKLAAAPERTDSYAELRQRGLRALMQHGFPDLKTEAWKYTSLRLLEQRSFSSAAASRSYAPALPFDADLLHFCNGLLVVDGLQLPDGVRLERATVDDFQGIEYGGREDAFAWLNLACLGEAWRLRIDGELDRPLALAFTTAEDFAAAIHPRLFIDLGENAQATLIELHFGGGEGMVNAVMDVRLEQGAALRHIMRRSGGELLRVVRTRVELSCGAGYRGYVLDTGVRLGRQDLNLFLSDAGAVGEIDGTVVVDSKQHVDYHTSIDHCVGHTNSRESFRLLADGSGVGVFNGRIHIHPGADDSHSDLNTGNLLLGQAARLNVKPELEIHAEEVTASHGATIGQIDDNAVFYLRSRGLPADDANTLLKYGFAAAPLEGVTDESIRDWLLAELHRHL